MTVACFPALCYVSRRMRPPRVPLAGVILCFSLFLSTARAEPFVKNSKLCQACHAPETEVWEKTKHASSFRTLHRSEKVDAILKAAGGEKNIRKNPVCVTCHYTEERDSIDAAPKVSSAVSCQKCHGPASEWLEIHNDYGASGATREKETPEHRKQRMERSVQAGMIRPDMRYETAVNCMGCHGLDRPGIDPAVFSKMMEAGHPANPAFELVRYSQGSVRHRFYPPDTAKNAEMPEAERARLFVTGQAAALVSASRAAGRDPAKESPHHQFQSARAEAARKALARLASFPEAMDLLDAPTEENARKLTQAIDGKDLLEAVKDLLPDKSTYR